MPSQSEILVRIHYTAARVVEIVEKKGVLGRLTPGLPATLRVDPIDGWTLLQVQLGTVEPGPICHPQNEIDDLISYRLDTLCDNPATSKDYSVGATSGDRVKERAGAVRLRDFQMVYASFCEDSIADEAIVLTIAILAGLLTKKAVTQRGRLNPRSGYFNPHLKRLLTHCT